MNKFMIIFSILLAIFFGTYTVLLLAAKMFTAADFWVPLAMGWFVYSSIKKVKELKAAKKDTKNNK